MTKNDSPLKNLLSIYKKEDLLRAAHNISYQHFNSENYKTSNTSEQENAILETINHVLMETTTKDSKP